MELATTTYILTGLWLVYLCIDKLLSGRWWLWNLNSLIPPFMLLVIPFVLICLNTYSTKSFALFVLLVASLFVVWPHSGVVLPSFRSKVIVNTANAVKVVSWNTEFWADGKDENEMIDVLRGAPADIYLLQEMWAHRDLSPVTNLAALQEAFPGYTLHQAEEHVTLSRFPVQEFYDFSESGFTRLDVLVNDKTVSIYNVHIPVHLIPSHLRYGLFFFRDMQNRFEWRQRSFSAFQAELESNPNPKVFSGDYNTSANMAELGWFSQRYSEAFTSLHGGYPTTYSFGPIKLWKIDWVFGDKVKFVQYHQQEHSRLSDHDLLQFEFIPE